MNFPREFEFVVDIPIEEAIQRLVDYIDNYNLTKSLMKYPRLSFESEGNGNYKVQGKAFPYSVTLMAHIKSFDSSTKVSGTADYHLNVVLWSSAFYLLIGIIGSSTFLPLLLIIPIFVVATWLNNRYERRLIIIHLHEILT